MSSRRFEIPRAGALALLGTLFCLWATSPVRAQSSCLGDCNSDNMVAVNEIITCVNIDLGSAALASCPVCSSDGSMVTIADLIKAVNNALDNCGVAPPTNTPGGPVATPTVTPTVVTNCPLQKGKYTITSLNGGTLTVSTLKAFPFPPGGTILADVGNPDPNCVHDVVVPAPGGFVSPIFCVPALGYTVSVDQTGCGIGKIDSDGGSDFTVTEFGDSSYDSTKDASATTTCSIAEPGCREGHGPAPDSSVLVRVTVGDGAADTCMGGGKINSIVSIPVHTTTWLAEDSGGNSNGCPDADGTVSPTDQVIVEFNQILDFTTDRNAAQFKDLDSDGCSFTGAGPKGDMGTTFSPVGTCLDFAQLGTGNKAGVTVASGTIGSSGGPLYDLTFTTTLPDKIDGPDASLGATCSTPPIITIPGTADRCIQGP